MFNNFFLINMLNMKYFKDCTQFIKIYDLRLKFDEQPMKI